MPSVPTRSAQVDQAIMCERSKAEGRRDRQYANRRMYRARSERAVSPCTGGRNQKFYCCRSAVRSFGKSGVGFIVENLEDQAGRTVAHCGSIGTTRASHSTEQSELCARRV